MSRRVLECPDCGSRWTRERSGDILVCLDCGVYFEAEDVVHHSRPGRHRDPDDEG